MRTHNRERCKKFKDFQKDQTTLTQDVGSDEVVARGFGQEACRQASVKMIILDELSFSVWRIRVLGIFIVLQLRDIFSHHEEPLPGMLLRCI